MRPWSLSMSPWTLRLSAGVASKKAAISPRRLGWFSFTASTKSAPLPVIASAMGGKHEIGPVPRYRVRDGGITSNGVDGHERALERASGGEPLQERRDRILLARLVGDRRLAEHKALVGREG